MIPQYLYHYFEKSRKLIVSGYDVISGRDFPLWVQKYNESGIRINKFQGEKKAVVYTSDLQRSIETGRLIGNHMNHDLLFFEVFP